MAVIGHEIQGNDQPSEAGAQAAPEGTDDRHLHENEAARPGPGVPLRWLLLVTAINLALAVGLLTLRPPWRVERPAEAPPALPLPVLALKGQIERGEHGAPYTLTLSDADLTATVGYFLAQSQDVPFSQVHVQTSQGMVEATGVTTGLAVAVPVRVQARVTARDGAPIVQISDVGIGGLPLPAVARDQIIRQASQSVDFSRYSLPVTVDAVELRAGVLEARGTVK